MRTEELLAWASEVPLRRMFQRGELGVGVNYVRQREIRPNRRRDPVPTPWSEGVSLAPSTRSAPPGHCRPPGQSLAVQPS